MTLQVSQLNKCIATLEASLTLLGKVQPETVEYEVYRNAIIKGFELTLKTSGKLVRKALKDFGGSAAEVDGLVYKDVLRHAGKHGLLDAPAITRWFAYRDNRNSTAHDYGVAFAEETLKMLPEFINDAKALSARLATHFSKGV